MQDLFSKIQATFEGLERKEKKASIIFLSLLIGLFFFVSGISVGEVFYKLLH